MNDNEIKAIKQARKLFVNNLNVDFGDKLYFAIKVHIIASTPILKDIAPTIISKDLLIEDKI